MANLTEDEISKMIRDETGRCALLCEMRGDVARASAAKLRKAGTFTTRALWPPFKRVTHVLPRCEAAARDMESVARAFDVVADCIRLGYDPRKLKADPSERIDLEAIKGMRC